jgi:MoaA/NifB/PqqE/SkfB family radical SAM enzyme
MFSSVLRKIRSIPGFIGRHARYFRLYISRPQVLFRRVYLYLEREHFHHNKVLTKPYFAKVNTGYICNLRCPLCPTGRRVGGPAGNLTLEEMRFIIPHIKGIPLVSLFGWGEPFLNKDIFEIIALLQKHGFYVQTDSNLNIKNEKIVEQIANCHIDTLSVSLDGVDQESYATYRYTGSFDLAFKNMEYIGNSPRGPKRVEWQYLVHKKNHMLKEKAREMAKAANIPIRFFDIGLYLDMFYDNTPEVQQEWWTQEQESKKISEQQNSNPSSVCMYMYNDPFIDPDGRLYPCCLASYAPAEMVSAGYQNVFGNLHDNKFMEIWNNEYYQTARSLFSGRPYRGKKVKLICMKCRVYLDKLKDADDPNLPIFDGHDNDSGGTG